MATSFKDRPLPVFQNLVNYTLYAPAIEEGGKQARLLMSFMDKRPRFTLYSNVSTDEKKGIVSAGYYPEIFLGILDQFENILKSEPGSSVPIRNLKGIRNDDGRLTGEKVVDSQLTFGKDETGLIYISLVAQGVTKIKFFFKLSEYHQIFKADKTPYTEEDGSILVARGWLNGIRKAVEMHSGALAAEKAEAYVKSANPKPAAATSNASMLDFEDDIPL